MYVDKRNAISNRLYDLTIYQDGQVVGHENGVSEKEKRELIAEYHAEGKTVHSVEVFSVTRNHKLVGDNPIVPTKEEVGKFTPGPVAATEHKIIADRLQARNNRDEKERKKINPVKEIRYSGTGENKNSALHDLYLAALKKSGFKVFNKESGETFFGFQPDIVEYLKRKINYGGYKVTDFDIEFLGKKD